MSPVTFVGVLCAVILLPFGFSVLFPIFMQRLVTWQNERAYRRRHPDGGPR